jgi:hypothetical protein
MESPADPPEPEKTGKFMQNMIRADTVKLFNSIFIFPIVNNG